MGANKLTKFRTELQSLLNRYSMEAGSDTPDYILVQYLIGCLNVYNATICQRERWYGREIRNRIKGIL